MPCFAAAAAAARELVSPCLASHQATQPRPELTLDLWQHGEEGGKMGGEMGEEQNKNKEEHDMWGRGIMAILLQFSHY